ncbi:MAG: hypothetical protein SGJ11_17340 [Phycisphaerae bacterium]|nr:hypothetical protein [Phycisphaerae bacterium]
MPASRSRTHEWRRSLQQTLERGGAIEIAIAHPEAHGQEPMAHMSGGDIVWRVRIVSLSDDEMVVEQPSALGLPIEFTSGIHLVGAIAIGQNRWTFRSMHIAPAELRGPRPVRAMRICMPTTVERSIRRVLRVDTAALQLPHMEMWPLLDPRSVIVAERWNEVVFEASLLGEVKPLPADTESMMPTVGPRFGATLMNLGGGGVGLRVEPEDTVQLTRHRTFWMRLDLRPEIDVPICATGKVVHTHIDSSMRTYAGVQFDFSFHPTHEHFVAEQIRRYIMTQQQLQQQAKRLVEDDGDVRVAA